MDRGGACLQRGPGKDLHQALGWRPDADFVTAPDLRVIQVTPPGPACYGNSWFAQEVTTRLPSRATSALAAYDSVAGLAGALCRAAAAHGKPKEKTGQPDPDRPDWYARYMAEESAGQMRGEGAAGGA